MGKRDFLSVQSMVNPKALLEIMKRIGASNFARKWLDRRLESGIMEDPHKAAENQINALLHALRENDQNGIDVHITHDWNMLLIREFLLGVKHEDVGWPDYLRCRPYLSAGQNNRMVERHREYD